ncbi:unnamed protein product [Camellia sinensis]
MRRNADVGSRKTYGQMALTFYWMKGPIMGRGQFGDAKVGWKWIRVDRGRFNILSALSTQLGSSASGRNEVKRHVHMFSSYKKVKRHVHMFSSYKKLVGSCAAICYMAIWVGYTDMHLIFGVSMTLEHVAQQGELNNQLKQ